MPVSAAAQPIVPRSISLRTALGLVDVDRPAFHRGPPPGPADPPLRPFLGIAPEDTPAAVGVLVADVMPGSAAHQAGIRHGDIVSAVDDHPVSNSVMLRVVLRRYRPGNVVNVTWFRRGLLPRSSRLVR